MSRKPTPRPEERFIGTGGVVCGVLLIPVVTAWLAMGPSCLTHCWGLTLFLVGVIPAVFYAEYLIRSAILLMLAHWRFRRKGIRGIVVLSDSPNWRSHIEANWLPRLSDQVVTLNWSQRRTWRQTLPVMLFRHFGIGAGNENYCPVVIFFRGLRHPYVYRCFYAFRDAKHGNTEALHRLETHMFAQFQRDGH